MKYPDGGVPETKPRGGRAPLVSEAELKEIKKNLDKKTLSTGSTDDRSTKKALRKAGTIGGTESRTKICSEILSETGGRR